MLDILKIARDPSEGDVFTDEQAERLAMLFLRIGTRSAASW
jgi:hypothetical protein